MTTRYVRQNLVAEPLFNQWYAWPLLISPMTAPFYVAHHCKIMQSFVTNPALHEAAVKNPAMLGGPFLMCEARRAPEIDVLLRRTRVEQAPLFEFVDAVKELERMLDALEAGMSLRPMYSRLPAPLSGQVELTYDLRNRPSARFIEALMYSGPLYRKSLQSLSLWTISDDARPFVFSTPRVDSEGRLSVRVPFDSEVIDELMRRKGQPTSAGELRELLGAQEKDLPLIESFLTEIPPRPTQRYEGPSVRVRYLGHACVLIEARGVSLLTDPVVSYPYPSKLARYTVEDLPPRIDYVLITHAHADHTMLETLLQLRSRIGTVVVPRSGGALQDPSLKLMLRALGFGNVVELDELERLSIPGGEVVGVPFLGEHGDLAIRSKIAHLIRLEGTALLLAADSNNLDPSIYERLAEHVGELDALFLGMECEGAPMSWVYGPLFPGPLSRKVDQARRLDGSDARAAAAIVECLKPKQVYVYAMGQEPWLSHVMALRYDDTSPQLVQSNVLIQDTRARGLVAERPYSQRELLFSK